MWDNIAELVEITTTKDAAGDPVEQKTLTQIFCNELSIGQTEFYQAMAAGLKPEIKIEVNRFEYRNEKQVKYNNVFYDVIRTYSPGNDITELTLGGGINGVT